MTKILLYNFLLKKTNKDCYKHIISFVYPTKKQMTKWLHEHREKTHCINKDWWKKCKYTYICSISKLGWIYNNIHKGNLIHLKYPQHSERITFYQYLLYMKKI